MKIVVNDQVHLSEFRPPDQPALVQHLNDRDIYDRTLRIPFPYTDASAADWLVLVARITEQQGRPVQFAVRSADDALDLKGTRGNARQAVAPGVDCR